MDLLRRMLFAMLLVAAAAGGESSTRILERGDLRLTVALPDRGNGHYRGIRFDHGGIVTDAVWRGHSLFGVLKPPRNPERHDGASGVPEEFDLKEPPGFADAADGDVFLKIGVGALVRPDRKEYLFSRSYALARPAEWTVREDAESITCEQVAVAGTYAVSASRTIRLLPDGDGFVIERTLTSTGTADLPFEQYNHTMVIFDGKPIDPGYALSYPAPATLTHKRLVTSPAGVQVIEALRPGQAVFAQAKDLPEGAAAATVTITHAAIGLALTLTSDTPPAKVVLYAEAIALCPEVFTAFTLKPGETRRWSQTYRCSAVPVPP